MIYQVVRRYGYTGVQQLVTLVGSGAWFNDSILKLVIGVYIGLHMYFRLENCAVIEPVGFKYVITSTIFEFYFYAISMWQTLGSKV